MATILIADDEAHIREVVQYALAKEGHTIVTASNGREALACAQSQPIDLVVLDVLMPELDGLAVCRRLRERGHVPIVFLSSRGEEIDRVLGLELGGDDYVTKPFSPRELVARINAVLRRIKPPEVKASSDITHGPLRLDPNAHEAHVHGVRVDMTVTEFSLLRLLLEHPGRVYARAQIIERLRSNDVHITERTIDTHVRRIRGKLRSHSFDPIETVFGLGYKARPVS